MKVQIVHKRVIRPKEEQELLFLVDLYETLNLFKLLDLNRLEMSIEILS